MTINTVSNKNNEITSSEIFTPETNLTYLKIFVTFVGISWILSEQLLYFISINCLNKYK